MASAQPIILEPIMSVAVEVPSEFQVSECTRCGGCTPLRETDTPEHTGKRCW
jgi:hypothetical protein